MIKTAVGLRQVPGSFPGARALGVQVRWSFGFVGVGTALEPVPGVIAIDVGGHLAPGVIDHHGGGTNGACAAEVAARRPELSAGHILAPLWREVARGVDVARRTLDVHIVTHFSPDFDSVVAAAAVQRWVLDGELPPWLKKLAAFASRVDAGTFHGQVPQGGDDGRPPLPLHETYLLLQSKVPWGGPYSALMARGLALVDSFEAALNAARSVAKPTGARAKDQCWIRTAGGVAGEAEADVPVLRVSDDHSELADLAAATEEARALFKADVANALTAELVVPRRDAQGEISSGPVKALAVVREPKCPLFKYFARRQGVVVLVWPFDRPRKNPDLNQNHPELQQPGAWFPKVAISTTAGAHVDSATPCLVGLGRRLEKMERAVRSQHAVRKRGGPPRWGDAGYCDNDDPWYDGRDRAHTIVEAPCVGTLLTYAQILAAMGWSSEGDRPADWMPYWEPTLDRACSVEVRAAQTPGPASVIADRQDTFQAALASWELADGKLCGASRVRQKRFHCSVPVGSGMHEIEIHVRTGAAIPLSEWADAHGQANKEACARLVAVVCEASFGSEVQRAQVLLDLARKVHMLPSGAAVPAVASDDAALAHSGPVFLLSAAGELPESLPSWLLPVLRAAVALEGLRAWKTWFQDALEETGERSRAELVAALSTFWLWESEWIAADHCQETGAAGRAAAMIRQQGPITRLTEDTRRLAERLDTVLERLDSADEQRSSGIMNKTLFVLAAIGVVQFIEGLQSRPLVWARDGWWFAAVAITFVGVLGHASRWWDRLACRSKSGYKLSDNNGRKVL